MKFKRYVATSVNDANVTISSTAQISEEKWVYTRPIMETCNDPSQQPRVLGTLGVEAKDEQTSRVFISNLFQEEVASISSKIEPYLSVLSGLKQTPPDRDAV